MVDVLSLQKEADALMKIKGTHKGTMLQAHVVLIKKQSGEKGVKTIQDALLKLGYPLGLEKIKAMQEYPEAQTILVSLLCQKLLGYTDKDIFDMGLAASKISFLNKIILKNFVSLDKVLKNTHNYWHEHVSVGDLKCVEYNKKDKRIVLQLENYRFHPLVCISIQGYFLGMIRFLLPTNSSIEETKCVHKGGSLHEFLIKWE